VTTELAVAGAIRYLAVWRVAASINGVSGSAWHRICRATAPRPAYVFVPAFTLMRTTMQRLGARLTQAQPEMDLTRGLSVDAHRRPALVGVGGATEPDFGPISPIVVNRYDSRTLAHFVFLAVESHEKKDLMSVDYTLEPLGEELLFIPAVWDPRYVHESNWRLLLREFDGQVA